MTADKHFVNKLSAGSRPTETQAPLDWLEPGEDERLWLSQGQSEARAMISRAAMVYLILFIGLGLGLSVLGVSPLANNGLMPKALLIFVGLSLFIALANRLADLSREHRRSWLSLARGLTHLAIRRR